MLIVITSPIASISDIRRYNRLFDLGLPTLHLRLPDADRAYYEDAIRAIEPRYRSRLILCSHFDLAPLVGAGGIHLSSQQIAHWRALTTHSGRISVSAHSIEELARLPFVPTYALLSPVFDSISKADYPANSSLSQCRDALLSLPFPVVALGGATPEREKLAEQYGFSGLATLGYLSDACPERFARFAKPSVLSIAGHDPCSGAGIVADSRTIEAEGGYPMTICSTLTEQHEEHFEAIMPIPLADVERALLRLLQAHRPLACKLGMVQSFDQARSLVALLRSHHIRYIVWDPILSASAGSRPIHQGNIAPALAELLASIDLITPNTHEAVALFGSIDAEVLQGIADRYRLHILLKGGHGADNTCSTDRLFIPDKPSISTSVPRTPHDKHGTGCTLSASIATRLAQGYDLAAACRLGQWCVDRLRRSHNSLLGSPASSIGMLAKQQRLQEPCIQYITDSEDIDEMLRRAHLALQGGIRWIQLRMKHASSAERLQTALALKELMSPYHGSTLIIDDDVEVALRSDAHGVHLGLTDMPIAQARSILGVDKIIGGTCNKPEDLAQRALEGADYVGVGPWRMTHTKANLAPLLGEAGMQSLAIHNSTLPIPLPMVAIGGIQMEDFTRLRSIGIKSIAVSGLINHASDIKGQAQRVLQAFHA